MKMKLIASIAVGLALAFGAIAGSASAQSVSTNTSGGSHTSTDRSIEYHGGPVMYYPADVYLIWYGCWDACGNAADATAQTIVTDFVSNVGLSAYFSINTGYPQYDGRTPTGQVLFGGSASDQYSRGPTLTEADIAGIVQDQLKSGALPLDPGAIYIVLTSADITLADGATQFCLTCCDLHGITTFNGTNVNYAFVGNPVRCPGGCGAALHTAATPNGSFGGDGMVLWLAHALNAIVTDPYDSAWFDRYGLENSEKCEGTYGTTYTVTNPDGQTAQANIQLGTHHFLLQQNWVNGKKGHCGMSLTQ